MTDDDRMADTYPAHPVEHWKAEAAAGFQSEHGFDVNPSAVLALGKALDSDASALDEPGGAIPEADAGVMTGIIEGAITNLLLLVQLQSTATTNMGEKVTSAALNYYAADSRAEERFDQALCPSAPDLNWAERHRQSRQMPYDPDEFEREIRKRNDQVRQQLSTQEPQRGTTLDDLLTDAARPGDLDG